MPSYILRVEGMNLSNVLDDADNLSVRRGGGLMILNAARQLSDTLPRETRERLHPIAQGASIGLFKFTAGDEDEAEALADVVRAHFRTGSLEYPIEEDGSTRHLPLRHGTFVVDVAEIGDDPITAVKLATTRNRWRQLQEPTVSLDDLPVEDASDACEIDRVRPATTTIRLPEKPNCPVSASVAARHAYGRGARQRFYEATCGIRRDDARFTDDFQTLAAPGKLDLRVAPRSTRDKLAVFYVDGNEFGRKGLAHLADGLDAYRAWSRALDDHHANLLRGLLRRAIAGPGWKNDADRIRLETLLWGGDEILWVVPAWKGWELVEWFFAQDHTLTIGGEVQPISYACGLVFCHVKAPIQEIVSLAHDLGDLAKEQGRAANRHRLAYEVMESFDALATELSEHRRLALPGGTDPNVLVIDPKQQDSFWSTLRNLAGSDDLPRRQLYLAARAWREEGDLRRAEKRLLASKAAPGLTVFRSAFGDAPAAWLHLLQMLPYIPLGL